MMAFSGSPPTCKHYCSSTRHCTRLDCATCSFCQQRLGTAEAAHGTALTRRTAPQTRRTAPQTRRTVAPNKTVLSTKHRGSCSDSPLLAFLFLCESKIATEPLWRDFFEAAGDWRALASIYVHVGSKSVTMLPTTSFFSGHEIVERVPVVWGDGSIMRATVALLRAALHAPCNARFALLSDTCAPLHPLRCTHAWLMRARRSFVEQTPSSRLRSKYAGYRQCAHCFHHRLT